MYQGRAVKSTGSQYYLPYSGEGTAEHYFSKKEGLPSGAILFDPQYTMQPGESEAAYLQRVQSLLANQSQPTQQSSQPTQQATQPTQQSSNISQQDYQLKPGETIDQYNARIAALRSGSSSTSTTTPQQTGALVYDPTKNPSVVDLLNSVGQDASFAARQQLAQQYGIQNYSGTASQNQELAKKFTEMYNAKKGSTAPTSQSEYMSQAKTYDEENKPEGTIEEAEKDFISNYLSMNPVLKSLYDSINQELSAPVKKTTLLEEYQKIIQEQGILPLQTELMNIQNVMEGSEDDIRNEITASGGLATDSQVLALKGARNKTLLKEANHLQQQLAIKQDYVNQIMQFTQLDREQVEKDLDRKLGLQEKLYTLNENITSAARENYDRVIKTGGWGALSEMLEDSPKEREMAEAFLGLPFGSLSNDSFLTKMTPEEEKKYQFVSGTENQRSGFFDPTTGEFTPLSGGGGGTGGRGLDFGGYAYGTPEYTVAAIRESSKYGKTRLLADERKDINSAKQALGSLEIYNQLLNGKLDNALSKEVFGEKSGVITGRIRTLQGIWGSDPNAAAVNAVIQGIIPTVARGIFREVGVLTDADIANYKKTVPDINKPENANRLIELVLLKTLERAYSNTLLTAAQNQTNVSNFEDEYLDVTRRISSLSSPTAATTKTGTLPNGTKVTLNADGSITDAQGNKYDEDGNRIGTAIPWNALQFSKIQ